MLNAIIIEDEKPAARRLERMLVRNGLVIQKTLHSVKEATKWLQNNPNPDLLFLDIQLSDGISFEIFENVSVKSAIIFTTAYDEYALKAFKLNSIDYLLKPIDEDELQTAIQKFKVSNSKDEQMLHFDKLRQVLEVDNPVYKERFTVQIGQHMKLVETKDIECLYSKDKATYAYLKTHKAYILDGSLESIFEQLDPNIFFKVSRKFIINLNAINDIISYTNSRLQIKLKNYREDEIIVSREKVSAFKKWLS